MSSRFEDDGPRYEQLGKEELSSVSVLAQQLGYLTYQRGVAEEQLKKLKEDIRRIEEESLPTAMLELGLESVTLEDGSKIGISTDYYAEIPKARAHEAFAWLRAHNYDSIIKNEIKAMFGKGEDALATAMVQFAASKQIDISTKQAVHPQTLKAFVREKAEAGSPVPDDLFGVFIKRVARLINR